MRRPLCHLAVISLLLGGCTLHHSRQALDPSSARPSEGATFVSEEDSGLAILGIVFGGIFLVSEPDHYAVLMERLRRHHRCSEVHHAQLDFYTDNWLLVTFPIARVTAICEPVTEAATEPAAESEAAAEPAATAEPAAATEPDVQKAVESAPAADVPVPPAPAASNASSVSAASDAPAAPAP